MSGLRIVTFLLEYRCECDGLEALERRGVALDLHAQDRALPRREQEVGKLVGRKGRADFAGRLPFGDAGREWRTPLREDRCKPFAQRFAVGHGFEAEVADQAPAAEIVI